MKHRILLATVFCFTLLPSLAQAERRLSLSYLTLDGIHVSNSGTIYAADGFDGSRVYKITPKGVASDFGSGLDGPIDITEDSLGNLFVTNLNSAKVSKITPDGVVTDFAQTNEGPAGITIDSKDNLYVSHFGAGSGDGSSILKITPDGETSVFSEGGILNAPVGITTDDDDNIYVANFNNGAIIRFDQYGGQTLIASIESDVGFAIGHLVSVGGRLFATGLADKKIYVIRKNGRVRVRDIVAPGEFPNGIAFNPTTNEVMFINTGAPASAFTKIRIRRSKKEYYGWFSEAPSN